MPTESDSPLVTVPCACGADLSFGDAVCAKCSAPVPSQLREALEDRLEGAHLGYRDAKKGTRRAATVVLIIALLHLGIGLVLYLVATSSDIAPSIATEGHEQQLLLAANSAIGVALLGCYFGSRTAPATALTAALGIWLAVRIVSFAIAPQSILLSFLSFGGIAVLLGRFAVLLLLIRGVVSARELTATVRALSHS